MSAVLLIALTAALIYAAVQARAGAPWARPASVALAVLVLLVAGLRWSCSGRTRPEADPAATLAFVEVCDRELAAALGKFMPRGSQAIVFAMAAGPEIHEAMRKGLDEGFKPYQITVAGIYLPLGGAATGGAGGAPAPGAEAPPAPEQQQETYEAILEQHPQAGGVIIYGDPLSGMDRFVPTGTKRLPLGILATRLVPHDALQRVKDGSATVVIVARPNADRAKLARIKDPRRRFRQTYLVITPDTVAEVHKALR